MRAELRSLQAWYRNLPTIIHIISSEEEDACRSGNATLQKQLEKELKCLRDPKMIAFGIVLCSILDLYAQVSLNAQDLNLFPTTVAAASLKMCVDLEDLTDEWKWTDEDLKLAGTGNPLQIIHSLEKGIYKPHLSQAVKINATKRINVQINEHKRFRDSFNSTADVDDTVQDLLKLNCNKVTTSDLNIPEIPVTGFEEQEREEVEKKLENLCGNSVKSFKDRVENTETY